MPSPTIKGVIFDLDGTLLDTLGDLTTAVNLTAQDYALPQLTRDQVSANVGSGLLVTITKSLPQLDAAELPNALTCFKKHYANCYLEGSQAYPGIVELLSELQKRNIHCAIVSNKLHDYVVKLVDARFPDFHFDLIYGESATQSRKPDPQGLLMACQVMGLSPDEVIMIGDSDADYISAQRINMRMLGVSWGFNTVEKLRSAGVKSFIYTAQELLEAL